MEKNKKNFIGVVFARANSKGLKNKNILKFKNTSLVEHAIKQAYQTRIIKKVFISSDSLKIINRAKKQNAIVPFVRPKKLCADNSPEILSWKHFVKYLFKKKIKTDFVVCIPTTSPLRSIKDIKDCMHLANKGNYDVVICVAKSNHSPYFNLLKKEKNSFKLLKYNKKIFRRQESPEFYNISTACYVFKPKYILSFNNLFSGKTGFLEIPKIRALDIDDKYDYKIAKLLQ